MAEYIERTEELMLAMNAGARAIENTKRYHGAVYTNDVFSEASQEIPYLLAAKVLREVSDTPAADVAPVVHGRWEMRPTGMATDTGPEYKAYCTACNEPNKQYHPPFCPHCGAKMDGGDSDAAD